MFIGWDGAQALACFSRFYRDPDTRQGFHSDAGPRWGQAQSGAGGEASSLGALEAASGTVQTGGPGVQS